MTFDVFLVEILRYRLYLVVLPANSDGELSRTGSPWSVSDGENDPTMQCGGVVGSESVPEVLVQKMITVETVELPETIY